MRAWSNKKAPPPFIWHMTTLCLEFPGGAIRHFPAGSYHAQTADWMGEAELELMRIVHSFWYAFVHLSLSQWGEEQTRLITWLEKKPPPEPPTRRLDAVIAALWRASNWTMEIMEQMRADESH